MTSDNKFRTSHFKRVSLPTENEWWSQNKRSSGIVYLGSYGYTGLWPVPRGEVTIGLVWLRVFFDCLLYSPQTKWNSMGHTPEVFVKFGFKRRKKEGSDGFTSSKQGWRYFLRVLRVDADLILVDLRSRCRKDGGVWEVPNMNGNTEMWPHLVLLLWHRGRRCLFFF